MSLKNGTRERKQNYIVHRDYSSLKITSETKLLLFSRGGGRVGVEGELMITGNMCTYIKFIVIMTTRVFLKT